jgi:hypothetical protein
MKHTHKPKKNKNPRQDTEKKQKNNKTKRRAPETKRHTCKQKINKLTN